ncbi:MAG: hypothetical protein KIS78_25305, partial [Labilithrix sp.]|nr:hypothetical protein [Labilithrix sp.]
RGWRRLAADAATPSGRGAAADETLSPAPLGGSAPEGSAEDAHGDGRVTVALSSATARASFAPSARRGGPSSGAAGDSGGSAPRVRRTFRTTRFWTTSTEVRRTTLAARASRAGGRGRSCVDDRSGS